MSGGGGGVAIGNLIENAASSHGTLMVNSTPIVIRALTGEISQNFRDLTLVAGTVGDYAAIVVRADSPLTSMDDALEDLPPKPRGIRNWRRLGSRRHGPSGGGHRDAGCGRRPTAFNYIGYDAGGDAMAGLLSGEIDALSTGFSEAVALAEQGEVRILGVTAPERVPPMMRHRHLPNRASTPSSSTGAASSRPRAFQRTSSLPIRTCWPMMETPEWETVRARMGLVNIFRPGDEFRTFLEGRKSRLAI
jgi:putative tricarboxylic transport membrane protein